MDITLVKFKFDEWDAIAEHKPDTDMMVDWWLEENYGLQFNQVNTTHQIYSIVDKEKYLLFVTKFL